MGGELKCTFARIRGSHIYFSRVPQKSQIQLLALALLAMKMLKFAILVLVVTVLVMADDPNDRYKCKDGQHFNEHMDRCVGATHYVPDDKYPQSCAMDMACLPESKRPAGGDPYEAMIGGGGNGSGVKGTPVFVTNFPDDCPKDAWCLPLGTPV